MKRLLELFEQLKECAEVGHDALGASERDALRERLCEVSRMAAVMAEGMQEGVAGLMDQRRDELLQRALADIAYARYDEAERRLLEAQREFPCYPEYDSHLGLVAWERGDIEGASRHYLSASQKSLAAMPEGMSWHDDCAKGYLRALEGHALSLYRSGDLEGALCAFEVLALTNTPEYQGCYYLLGEVFHVQGRLQEALSAYEMAPVEPGVLYNKALVHFQLDQLHEAASTFLEAFEGNADVCRSLLGMPMSGEETEGYLGSSAYAQEFLEACALLWDSNQGAHEFMKRCFLDPAVQRSLCEVLSGDPATEDCAARAQRRERLAWDLVERFYY